ncbi:MAG: nucleoside deaminase [Planctomycetaceae bacterium]
MDLEHHEPFMRRAIEIARQNPKAPFGAVIADSKTSEIVAEGVNREEENPIWHGEMVALHTLTVAPADRSRLILYTTAEPCPMCQAAIVWSGIGEVVYGTSTSTLLSLGLPAFVVRAEEVATRANFAACDLVGGVLEAECDELFRTITSAKEDA